MPSLRQISTSRIIQLTKAPMAQIVMICHSPPSASGAGASPYSSGGGSIEISQGFQVSPSAAP